MAKAPTLTSISSGYLSATALNSNFDAIEAAFLNTLSRDGSTPNQMEADIDLNSNDLLNVNTTNTNKLFVAGEQVVPADLEVVNISVDLTDLAKTYDTIAAAQADTVDADYDTIFLLGYHEEGDGGLGAVWHRSASEPSHAGKFQDAGGAWWELTKRQYVNVRHVGAKGDGVNDDTTAIQNAIDIVEAEGEGTVYLPAGDYLVSSGLVVDDDQVHIVGDGKGRTVFKKSTDLVYVTAQGSGLVTGQSNTLAADVAQGDVSVTLSAGKGANFSSDTWAMITHTGTIPGANVTNANAEFIHILDVTGDVLTVSGPLGAAYTTANTAQVFNIGWVKDFRLSGVSFDGMNFMDNTASASDNNVIEIEWALRPEITGISAWQLPNIFIQLTGCFRGRITDVDVQDQLSNGYNGATGTFGYSICELSLNEGLVVDNLIAERVRHAYTTSFTSAVPYGFPKGTRVSNSVAIDSRGAGWDTHEEGQDISFSNCGVIGSNSHGFQFRSLSSSMVNCYARDVDGFALNIHEDAFDSKVLGFWIAGCNGGIEDDGQETFVSNFTSFDACPASPLKIGAAGNAGVYRNLWFNQPGANAVIVPDDGPTRFTIDGLFVFDTTGNMTYGVRVGCTTVTDGRVSNLDIRGATSEAVSKNVNSTVHVVNGIGGEYGDAIGDHSELTIANSIINIKGVDSTFIKVNGEGGVADNVNEITGGTRNGQRITITKGDANIGVLHGTGNIYLNGSTNATLADARDNITLILNGSSWVECGRGIM